MTTDLHAVHKEKLWTKYYIIVMIVTLLFGVSSTIHMSTLPLYAQEIGGDKSAAGMLTGLFSFSALLFRPPVGKFVDSKGRKIVLMAGIFIVTAVSFFYSFTQIVWVLLMLRFIHGIGMSAQSTTTGTIVADLVPHSRLMEGIGYFGISNVLATAIGPALGLYLIDFGGYRFLYLITFAICLAGAVLAAFINYEKERKAKLQEENKHQQAQEIAPAEEKKEVPKGAFFEKTTLLPAAIMLFVSFSMSAIMSFLPSYALSRNVSSIGLFFTVYAGALLISRLFTGRLSDRFGATVVFIPGLAIFTLSLFTIAMATSLQAFLVAAVFYGLGSGTVMPILNAITIKLCPPDRRGAANATFFAAIDVGMGAGSIVWGFVSQNAGFPIIYFLSTAIVIIPALLYLFGLRKKLQKA